MKQHFETTLVVIGLLAAASVALEVPELPRQLKITVDGNLVDICVDGVHVPQTDIPNHSDVTKADTITIPSAGAVVAVKINNGNPDHLGFVASDSTGQFFTNSSWRCHVNAQPDQQWCDKDFDDSHWSNAVEIALYGQDSVGYIAGNVFSPSAYWIWTSADPSNNGVIYCRGTAAGDGSSTGDGNTQPPSITGGTGGADGSGDGSGDGSDGSDGSGGSGSGSGGSGSGSGGIDITPKTITKIVGEHVTIYAIASGATSQSSWTKDNQVVSSLPAIHISAVAEADAGLYATTFSNSAGSTTFQAKLNVLVPPVLSGATTVDIQANIGDPIVFNNVDVIAGNPTPVVTWYKDGAVLTTSAPSIASSQNDAGTYVIVAENAAGITVHYAILRIQAPLFVIGPSSPAQVTRHAGTATTIFCSVHGGDPCNRPTVSWTKNGAAFSGNDGSLVFIRSVNDADSGSYVCTYADRDGRSLSYTIQLTVVDPAIIGEPTVEDLSARGGSSLCLTCPLVSGTAPVTQSSYIDGQLQTSSGPVCRSPVDYTAIGTYACVQSNSVGDDVKFSYVNVSVLIYEVSSTELKGTSLASTSFLFQMKATGPVIVALSNSPTSFTNNNLYQVTIGANANTQTTVGKMVKGNDKNLKTYSTPGVLASAEFRWYWMSSPAAGQVLFGTGSVIGQNVLVSYSDTSSSKVTACCVGLATAQQSAAVVLFYP